MTVAEHLNGDTFAGYIQDSALPVLVDFYRDGCVPCRRVAPLLSKAEAAYEGKLAVVRVNSVQNVDLAAQYDIQAAPTLVLFDKGVEIARHRGVIDRDGLEALIQSAIHD